MSITLDDLKAHLRLDAADASEDALLTAKISAASAWVAAYLGEPTITSASPAPVLEAVRQLASGFYEDREGDEGSLDDVARLLTPFRNWTF